MYNREEMKKILTENNVFFRPVDTDEQLAEYVRDLGLTPPLEEQKVPNIHFQKQSEGNLNEVRKGLEQQGFDVPTQDELDREREAMKLTQGGEIVEAMKLFSDTIASSFMQMAEQQKIDNKNQPKQFNGAELIIEEQVDIRAIIDKDPKVPTMAIPIQRNILKQSVMDKEYLRDKRGEFVKYNGSFVVTEYYQVKINGQAYKYNLGPDDGIRPVAYIHNIPWSVAKIIAEATNQPIPHPETGKIYHPKALPIPAHDMAIDGETGQNLYDGLSGGVSGIGNVYKDVMQGQFPFQQHGVVR